MNENLQELRGSTGGTGAGVHKTITVCAICTMRCGLEVHTRDGRFERIVPDRENPFTWRDFCIKGATANQAREHPNRLLTPMRRVGERYVPATYEEAVEDISARVAGIIDQHGPDAVGGYFGNPICFSSANLAFAEEFLKRLGTRNKYFFGSVDENARHVAGREMYGGDYCFLQIDLDRCEFYMLIGANPAVSTMSWCGMTPDGWRRVLKRVEAGAELVIVDPRRTESAAKATQHLACPPESDWALLLGMIQVIFREGLYHAQDCADATGLDQVREVALGADLGELAARCDLSVDAVESLARRFARARTAVCVPRTGPAIGRNGTLTEWLSHVLNLITGRIDRPGGVVFYDSPMNMLKVRPAVPPEPSRVRGLPTVCGYRSLAELPDEIETPGPGQLKAMFIIAGNPVGAGADGRRLDAALAKLDLLVSVDMFQRESHRHAHWLIPTTHFLERTEVTVYLLPNGEKPFVQKAVAAFDPPPGVTEEWQFLRDVAKRIGRPLYPKMENPTAAAIIDRALQASGAPSSAELDAWPHGLVLGERSFGRLRDCLNTPDGRIQACPPIFLAQLRERLAEPVVRPDAAERPYQIISRRRLQMMNTWLAETTGQTMRDKPGDLIEIHPADAARDGLLDGMPVRVRSATGEVEAVVRVSPAIRSGSAVMEQGWGMALYDPASGAVVSREGVSRNYLVSGEDLDEITGVPRLNGTPVAIVRA